MKKRLMEDAWYGALNYVGCQIHDDYNFKLPDFNADKINTMNNQLTGLIVIIL